MYYSLIPDTRCWYTFVVCTVSRAEVEGATKKYLCRWEMPAESATMTKDILWTPGPVLKRIQRLPLIRVETALIYHNCETLEFDASRRIGYEALMHLAGKDHILFRIRANGIIQMGPLLTPNCLQRYAPLTHSLSTVVYQRVQLLNV